MISGITTAASLLTVAVIAIAAGAHSCVLAVGATLLTLAARWMVGWVERQAATPPQE